MTDPAFDLDTLSVHAGLLQPKGKAAPSVPPIVPSVGYIHPAMTDTDAALGYLGSTPTNPDAYVYARHGGPNQAALEEAVAALEGAEGAVSFASGMAALHAAILTYVPVGGTIVAAEQLYGVTRSLLDWLSAHLNITVHLADFLQTDAALQRIEATRPQAVICEVLTNPLARIIEIDRIAAACQTIHAALLIDNTFATPYLLRPLAMGASAVIHSTTKFLNGHGDVTGGVIAGPKDAMRTAFQLRKLLGAVPSAFDAWLTLRGMRTFSLRMRQQCSNAYTVGQWLAEQPAIKRVHYPGLASDAGYEAAARLFRAGEYGSVMALEIAGIGRAEAFAFMEALKLIRPVTSLGDVYSLMLHPASSSHRALTPEQRTAQDITEGTLRLSVGIESASDLIADLEQALHHIQ